MKKIIAFFVFIYNWFISFFKRKEVIVEKETLTQKLEKRKESHSPRRQRIIPDHNNRKTTKGRFVQYINVGEGRTRPIYHGAK